MRPREWHGRPRVRRASHASARSRMARVRRPGPEQRETACRSPAMHRKKESSRWSARAQAAEGGGRSSHRDCSVALTPYIATSPSAVHPAHASLRAGQARRRPARRPAAERGTARVAMRDPAKARPGRRWPITLSTMATSRTGRDRRVLRHALVSIRRKRTHQVCHRISHRQYRVGQQIALVVLGPAGFPSTRFEETRTTSSSRDQPANRGGTSGRSLMPGASGNVLVGPPSTS